VFTVLPLKLMAAPSRATAPMVAAAPRLTVTPSAMIWPPGLLASCPHCPAARTRWTPNRIRKVTPFPKPQGALDRIYDLEAGRFDAGRDVTPAERGLLRHIADEADIVAETPNPDLRRYRPVVWLIVPLTRQLLDMLAEFETDEREAGTDREPDHDGEPLLGATDDINQGEAWRGNSDDTEDEHDGCEPDDGRDLVPARMRDAKAVEEALSAIGI